MAFWRFMDYITEEHANPIGDWYAAQKPEVQVAFDILLTTLAGTESWDDAKPKRRKYKLLTGKHLGLCELKFIADHRRFGVTHKYRAIGIWNQEAQEFILLGARQKWRLFTIPLDAFDTALRLKEYLDQRRGGLREHI